MAHCSVESQKVVSISTEALGDTHGSLSVALVAVLFGPSKPGLRPSDLRSRPSDLAELECVALG